MITSVSPKLPVPQTFTFVEMFPTKIDLNLGSSTSTSSHECPTVNTTPGYQVYIRNTLPPSPSPHSALEEVQWRAFERRLSINDAAAARGEVNHAERLNTRSITSNRLSYMREITGGQVAMLC